MFLFTEDSHYLNTRLIPDLQDVFNPNPNPIYLILLLRNHLLYFPSKEIIFILVSIFIVQMNLQLFFI